VKKDGEGTQTLDTFASASLFPRSLVLSPKAPLFLHLCSYLHNGGRSRVYSRMRARSTGKLLYLYSTLLDASRRGHPPIMALQILLNILLPPILGSSFPCLSNCTQSSCPPLSSTHCLHFLDVLPYCHVCVSEPSCMHASAYGASLNCLLSSRYHGVILNPYHPKQKALAVWQYKICFYQHLTLFEFKVYFLADMMDALSI